MATPRIDPEYVRLIRQEALAQGVDPALALSVLIQESHGKPTARNASGASGLMQLLPQVYPGVDVWDPKQAIPAGVRTLRDNLGKHDQNVRLALQEYYGGPNTRRWGPRTRRYPDEVLQHYASARTMVNPPTLSEVAGSDAPSIGKPPAVSQASDDDALSSFMNRWREDGTEGAPAESLAGSDSALDDFKARYPEEDLAPSQVTAMREANPRDIAARQQTALQDAQRESQFGGVMSSTGFPGAVGFGLSQAIGSPGWGPSQEFARGATLGLVPLGHTDARQEWVARNPNMAGVLEAGGATPTTLAAMQGGAQLAGGVLAPFAAAAPRTMGLLRAALGNTSALTSPVARTVSRLSGGAVQGAASAGMQSQLHPEVPFGEQVETGAVIGAPLNALTGGAIDFLGGRVRINPEIRRAVNQGRAMGLTYSPRPGQVAESGLMRRADAVTAGSHDDVRQLHDFTRDVSRTMGLDTPTLDRAAWESGIQRIRVGLDHNEGLIGLRPDTQLWNELRTIRDDWASSLGAGDPRRQAVDQFLQTFRDAATRSTAMTGDAYSKTVGFNSPLGRMLRDRSVAEAAWRMREAIERGVDRTVAASGSQTSQLALRATRQLRGQYRNAVAIEDLTNPTASGAHGMIDPRAYARVMRDRPAGSRERVLADLAPTAPRPTAVGTSAIDALHRLPWWAKAAGLGGGYESLEALRGMTDPATAMNLMAAAGGGVAGAALLRRQLASRAFAQRAFVGHGGTPINPLIPAVTALRPTFPDASQIEVAH